MAATKENENGVRGGFQFRPQVTKTKWQTFQTAIYDPSTGEFLGRTAKSWGQLLIFYSLFYVVLAALFAMCMQGLMATLDDDAPKWKLDDSLIGTNPGLGFRPISDRTEEGSLISYNLANVSSSQKWIQLMNKFLEPYSGNDKDNLVKCDFGKRPEAGQVCTVDLNNFGPCSPKNGYGYNNETSPCVFLKLNKIYGWNPDYFTTPRDDMPADLKAKILQLPDKSREQIWVSCEGEGPPDKENVHEFDYYPSQGFPSYYFPYQNTRNYLSPIIAVRVKNPKRSVIVSIECRAWAKNIHYKGGNLQREGSVHFEVLID